MKKGSHDFQPVDPRIVEATQETRETRTGKPGGKPQKTVGTEIHTAGNSTMKVLTRSSAPPSHAPKTQTHMCREP